MRLWIPDQPGREALGELPEGVSCHLYRRQEPPPRAIIDAEFLVPSWRTEGLFELFGQMPDLRVIQTLSAGVDWLIDRVPAAVTVCSARGARDSAVAEWVLGTILSFQKRLLDSATNQLEHRWAWGEPRDLTGATVMLLGYGSIAAAVERMLEPFQVKFIRVARRKRPGVHGTGELAGLIGSADVVVVALALTERTRGLLDTGLLERMRSGALLVNASRGAVLDTQALLQALHSGRIQAALDVTDPEPLPEDHPLWGAPNVLITPHIAGDGPGASARAFELVGEQVRRYVRGEALVNVVEDGY
jgi:phosphoglycerate dehydrogenase-like enzyme